MVPVALSDVIAVGEVPSAEDVEILAKAGFRSMLNTQPDGEVERLMSSADAKALAEKSGMVFQHLPISSRRPDAATLTAFATALNALPKPIYACCYSGARTAAAWAIAAARHQAPADVMASCTAAGYDISFLEKRLVEAHNGTTQGEPAANGNAAAETPAIAAALVAVPNLAPNILIPRAASAGGFAVAG
jgi:sulfide:quinone oxidoreductase